MNEKEKLEKTLKALAEVKDAIDEAFLRHIDPTNDDSDWDWDDTLTEEQYDALNKLSTFAISVQLGNFDEI